MTGPVDPRIARLRGGAPGRRAMFAWLARWVLHPEPPYPLWHFTTREGLEGILSSETIHATNTRDLLDKGELRYGQQLFNEVLGEVDWRGQPEAGELLRRFAAEGTLRAYLERLDLKVFVASLCQTGDDWGMWREYAGWGTPAGAFSLGLTPANAHGWAQLTECVPPNTMFLRPVIYDRPTQIRACTELIEALAPILEGAQASEDGLAGAAGLDFAESLTAGILEISSWCKDSSFEHELEWRLVYQRWGEDGGPPVQQKPSAFGMKEYVPLRLPNQIGRHYDRLPVTVIKCGPGIRRDAAEGVLAQCGDWAHVDVIESDL